MINIGSEEIDVGQQTKTSHEDEDEESKYQIRKATTQYKTTMVSALVKPFTNGEVDFVIDSPQTVSFFAANLIYLGLEHTPLTHVD